MCRNDELSWSFTITFKAFYLIWRILHKISVITILLICIYLVARNYKSPLFTDIAGGRGDLAFELSVKYDLKCVVIDPRQEKAFFRKKYQRKRLKKCGKEDQELYKTMNKEFNLEFFQSHPDFKTSTSLVVGLHPDQATEPLFDSCLNLNIPFAAIPCCVFSHENPHRVLQDGSVPNTYETFCEYLLQKADKGLLIENLAFQGRNKVIFKTWTKKAAKWKSESKTSLHPCSFDWPEFGCFSPLARWAKLK